MNSAKEENLQSLHILLYLKDSDEPANWVIAILLEFTRTPRKQQKGKKKKKCSIAA